MDGGDAGDQRGLKTSAAFSRNFGPTRDARGTAGAGPPAPTTAPRPEGGGVDVGAGLTPVVPSPLAEQLAPYQREGVRWMLDKLSRPLCGTPDQRGAPRRGQRRGPRKGRALLPPRCGPWRRQRAPLGAQRPQARPARRPSLHAPNTSSRTATRDTPTPASGRSSTRPQRGASSPRTARTASTATSSRPRAAARAWACTLEEVDVLRPSESAMAGSATPMARLRCRRRPTRASCSRDGSPGNDPNPRSGGASYMPLSSKRGAWSLLARRCPTLIICPNFLPQLSLCSPNAPKTRQPGKLK